jgi:DNA-binding response OmpR family regulator
MRKKVLIIDDDDVLRELVGRLMEMRKADFELLSADTCKKGMEIARRQQPDAIILDIMLPGENGWETAEALQQDPRTRAIPIIIASGAGSAFDEDPHIERTVIAAYIRKPYDLEELVATIKRVVKQ